MADLIILKLQPNQDVTEALEAAVREAGLARARIRGAVGSLVEAVIEQQGAVVRVPGPGLEIAGLCGEIDADGASRLSGFVCQADTGVEYGPLVRGLNAVGVTFEVVLEPVA